MIVRPPRWAAGAALLAGLALVSLLPNPGAAVPGRTYYFRDFTAAFHPLRLFTAREMAEGRIPFWNPYLHEGTFVIPSFYPLDLLLALAPGAASTSWVLTLHFPIAALGFFWLGRDLGLSRLGAFVAGAVYAMGGLALSTLNLYVFLQALALAPVTGAALRRAALHGRRWVPLAAIALAAAVSTLAIEFVAQAVLLGLILAVVSHPPGREARPALIRVAAALVLGLGLAAVPVAVTAGLLPETVRGAGFGREEALSHAAEPVHLLQALVSGLLGPPHAPLSDGRVLLLLGELPYFTTLYVGPFVLSAAACGGAGPRHRRWCWPLAAAGAAGLWVALGERAGLAVLLSQLPGLQGFRYPSKALLLPYVAVAAMAGAGIDRVRRGSGWAAFGGAAAACLASCAALAAALGGAGDRIAHAFGVAPDLLRVYLPSALNECLRAAMLSAAAAAVALAAARGLLRPQAGGLLVAAMLLVDLARAGAFVNPQTSPQRLELAPEIAAQLDVGTRAFSYGVIGSPAFVRCATVRRRGIEAWAPWVSRQVLAPYTNMIDRIETAATPDLTGLGPRVEEPTLADLHPDAVGRLLPRLREAAVARVLSLDRLQHPGLRPRKTVPLGMEGLAVHVYDLVDPLPREHLDCAGPEAAPGPGACAGSVRRVAASTDDVSFHVAAPQPVTLVMRETFARGWEATIDGAPASLLRAGASHRAVAVPAGAHHVRLRYRPPGLGAGVFASTIASLAVGLLLVRPPR